MLEVLQAEPALRNRAAGFAPRPDWRPLTKFENRGLQLGHGVWDLVFERLASAAPADETPVLGRENEQAEADAVPGERPEIVARDPAQ